MYSVLPECFLPVRTHISCAPSLAQRAAQGSPAGTGKVANICSKIQEEIGRELSRAMFLETKRSEAGP